jgi:hypothetical protein
MARTNTTVRNYQHATRIFRDGNFRLSPKYGFLFYVEFDFNPKWISVKTAAFLKNPIENPHFLIIT